MKRSLLLFLLIPFLAAQTTSQVRITSEPSHHLALENEYIRVFKVEVAPHASTLMHHHRHDYVFVTLGDAHVSNEVEGKPPVDLKLSDGEVRFVAGNFAHVAKNLSDQPFRNATIELTQDERLRQTPSHWPEKNGEKDFPSGPDHNSLRERWSARVRSQPRTGRDRTQPPSRRSASAGRH